MSCDQIGTLAYEFPDYPAESLPAIPDWLVSQHYHNDSSPSWAMTAADGRTITLHIDWPDKNDREIVDDSGRYVVLATVAGQDYTGDVVMESDDWSAVLAMLTSAHDGGKGK